MPGRSGTPHGFGAHVEYEDLLVRGELFDRSPLLPSEREAVFGALVSVCACTPIYDQGRPKLPDPNNDHLIELALPGGADWTVTANTRDVGWGELRFGDLRAGTAGDFLDRYRDNVQEAKRWS